MTHAVLPQPRARIADESVVLFESLDWDGLPAKIAALVVPALADFSTVFVVDGERLRPAASRHRSESKRGALEALHASSSVDLDESRLPSQVLKARRPRLVAAVTDEVVASLTQGEEQRRLLLS